MVFLNFLIGGVPAPLRRASHSPDWIEANGPSSFCYAGIVTSEQTGEKYKIVNIDGSVRLKTVPDRMRKEAQQKLDELCGQSLLFAVASCALALFSCKKGWNSESNRGTTFHAVPWIPLGATFSLGLFLGGYRAAQSMAQRREWDDPTEKFCAQRRNYATRFVELKQQNLKGMIFTSDETKDLFLQTMQACIAELELAQRMFDPNVLKARTAAIIQECPLDLTSIAYAFPKDERIFNPKNPSAASAEKSNIVALADKWGKAVHNFNKIIVEAKNQEEIIAQRDLTSRSVIESADQLYSASLHLPSQGGYDDQQTRKKLQEEIFAKINLARKTKLIAHAGATLLTMGQQTQLNSHINDLIMNKVLPDLQSIFKEYQKAFYGKN